MTLFQFYQKRDFGELISDTFNFFKIYFRNYFKNYLIINGALILSFVIIVFLLIGGSFSNFLQGLSSGYYVSVLYSLLAILLLFFVIMLFNSCFPLAYAAVAEENPERNTFSPSEIFVRIKSMLGRVFLFAFISIFILTIPIIIIGILSYFIPIIGQFIFSAITTLFITISMIFYVKDKKGYFDAFGKTFEILKIDFWTKIGANIVMNFIVTFISTLILIIPFFFVFFGGLIGISSDFSKASVIVTGISIILFAVTSIVVFVLSNIVTFLQLIIYYSSQEDKQAYIDLEQIGKDTDD